MISNLWNTFVMKLKKVKTGDNLKVYGQIMVHGKSGRISIGNNVVMISEPRINPTGGGDHVHLRTEGDGKITIGNNVGLTRTEIASYNSVVIDDDVLIGGGVRIWDTDFHSINYQQRMQNPDTSAKTAPIHISKGAFIGACSIVLKGVTIGERSVIGAGSVVTKNVPADEIWAGNPAKFIKRVGNA